MIGVISLNVNETIHTVKTSDQPSFSSSNFSPFTSVEAHRLSDISPAPSLN
jgi:hypothetical protein